MGYVHFKRPVQGSYLDRRNPPYMKRAALASAQGGQSFNIDRFNPQKDRLEDGSVMEEWIPRQPTNLHLLLRKIYLRDAIAGSVVDTYSTLPWGKNFEIIGIEDPKVLQMYRDMVEGIGIWQEMPMISREILIIGRVVGSLVFNERQGLWDSLVPIDPDQVRLTPMPVSNMKPLVDVLSSPGWREFARSTDPRVLDIKSNMNTDLLAVLQNSSGWIPLEPANTLFLARRVNQYDHIGTSLYSRILPAWAYEMALWNASLTGARRRNRSIMLVTAGQEETWEPNDSELNSLTNLFMQADEDPTGAVIAVRQGVEVSEVRDPTAIWGISQEFEFLSTLKMRSLGVSEAYLSGEVNVSTMEAAKSSLGKNVAAFRDFMIQEIFHRQLFPTFARIHNFRKKTQAQLDHRINVAPSRSEIRREQEITAKAAINIPYNELLIPQFVTEDTLRPEQDPAYMELLTTLKGEGLPIPLRLWASAAGYDLDKAMAMIPDDITLRKRLAQLSMGGGEGGGDEGGLEGGGGGGGAEEDKGGDEGGMEDLFKGEGSRSGGGGGLKPKWGFATAGVKNPMPYQRGHVLSPRLGRFSEEQINAALKELKDGPLAKILSHVSPQSLTNLRLPATTRELNPVVPYIPDGKELKVG